MNLILTRRLALRELVDDDAAFLVELLNEPDFIANIGDRKVRNEEDARHYLAAGPRASYERHGFGLWRVALRADDQPLGICGLLKRDTLDDVDIGFAFLARHRRQGYALESGKAVMEYGRRILGIPRVVAITAPHNAASGAVLEKLGLVHTRMVSLAGVNGESRLYEPE